MSHDQAPRPTGAASLERQRVQQELRARLFGAPPEPVRIDRFEIRRRLGAGAMGVVYAGFDPRLSREVAIKLMTQASLSDPNHFHHEARALARLSHPFVLQVHEAGLHQGVPYLVSELVAGGTLREWLAASGAPRSTREILSVLLDAGRGLAAAHQRGLVHRDIKPENVLVGADGRPRVSDFGLASVPDPTALFTAGQGGVAGTLRYMAPEQLRGEGADPQSDQFGFCVMAFEALFGRLPFDGGTPESWLASISAGPVAPAPRGHPAAPLLPALRRGLAARPAGRFPSMIELLSALERAAGQRGRRLAALAAGALLVGAAALVGLAVRPRASPGSFSSSAEVSVYSEAVALMYRGDFRGCDRRLAAHPKSERLARLRAECVFKVRDARGLAQLCGGWRQSFREIEPDPCDPVTLQAVALFEQRRYRECVDLVTGSNDSASHSLILSDCTQKLGTPDGYFRQCVWIHKNKPNGNPGECRKITHLQ